MMLMCPYNQSEAGVVPGVENAWNVRCGKQWAVCRLSEESSDPAMRCELTRGPPR